MITLGKVNKLTLEASGYSTQDCRSEWDDFLMIDIKYYSGKEIAFQYSFPCIMAKELADLPGEIREFMSSEEDKIIISFLEPNIVFTFEKYDEGKIRVTAEIFMTSYKDGNTIIKKQVFEEKDFEKFIGTLERDSKKFPPRF
ncbi:MAG: hypothetical protein J1E40_08730 [Oscillospiraceae bacterium]|nr:hypothetical protein [Oscillospiraceae bacterium]